MLNKIKMLLTCFVFLLCHTSLLFSGDTTVNTPEGRSVPADTPSEMGDYWISYYNSLIDRYIMDPNGDGDFSDEICAVRIGNSSNTYNCHGYAWSLSEGGEQVWIGTYEDPDVETYYWTDGGWSNDGQPSYTNASEAEATHAWYTDGDHSVRKIRNSYPTAIVYRDFEVHQNVMLDYVSKWGYYGLYQHAKGHDVYKQGSTSNFLFKKLKTAHSGTLSNYPKTWVGAGGKTHTISGNISCPNNVTIKSGATVSLNNYSIASTGGKITVEGGAAIDGLAAKRLYGFDVKGLYSTVQNAINSWSYPHAIHVQTGNFNELVTISNKPHIIVGGEYSSFVNGISIYNSDGAELTALSTSHLFLSGCTLPYIQEVVIIPYSEEAEGSFFAYNSSYINLVDITLSNTPYGYGACFSNTTGLFYPIYGMHFENNELATLFYYGSNFTMHHPYFCSNGTDISTDGSSYVMCDNNPTFSGDPNQTTNGNVGWTSYSTCGGLSKSSPPAKSSAYVEEDVSSDRVHSLNALYHAMSEKMSKPSHDGDYSQDFSKFVDECKSFISSNKESPFAATALNLAAHSYKQIKDYEGMKTFVEEVMANRDLASLHGQAKRHLIDYYAYKKDYCTALTIADEILADKSADTNMTCDVLLAKGFLHELSMNDTKNAQIAYASIIDNYPKNLFAKMAAERMRASGDNIEAPPKTVSTTEASNDFSINNYPNPFNPSTTIRYALPTAGCVTLRVYDILGREVATLVNEMKSPGRYEVVFDGSRLASGVYFYRLTAPGISQVKKMLLTK